MPTPVALLTAIARRCRLGIGGVALVSASLAGCQGGAYREVYQQRMAREIRVLEDQLYEAEYENQVLRDDLARFQVRESQIVVPSQRPPRTLFGKTLSETGEVIAVPQPDASPDMSVPETDPANLPSPSGPAPSPAPSPTPSLPASPLDGNELPAPAFPAPEAAGKQPAPLLDPPALDQVVPPAEPMPPGKSDLMVPEVELGEPVPPPAPGAPPDAPPGKIELPETAKVLDRSPPAEPASIRVHMGLSGGHKSDDQPAVEGMRLFVEAIDERGQVVRLEEFDIAAQLSLVLLDPAKSPDQARLGKWDFGPEKIREMIRTAAPGSQVGSGIEIIVPWGELRPESNTVVAHLRLAAGDVAMQTKAELPTALPTMAQWTPRASLTR